ncbi:TGBp1 family protein, partial [Christensenellaceae bacterium OttesenSCG-928-L17]|nr:TGBp1 family protein [Christensenellaceae bacterium OttesenSCG-928-L17]
IQDVSGYDFSWLLKLCNSRINIVMVGDYKQTIFSTNSKNIHGAKTGANLLNGLEEIKISGRLQIEKSNKTLRFNSNIASYANRLFEQREYDIESEIIPEDNDGVFIIADADYQDYLSEMGHIVFLRYDKRDSRLNTLKPTESYNFGDCKGMTFERVAISTTTKTLKAHIVQGAKLADKTKAKYYIALTRARKSVAILMDTLPTIPNFIPVEMICNGKTIELLKYCPREQ